jgi:hypothetical protein
MARSILLALLFVHSPFVLAQGFDYTYEAFSGDLNGDAATDLYIRSKASAFVTIPFDDLPIVVPTKALPKEFVLHGKTPQNPAWVKLQLTPSDRSAVASWPSAANVSLLKRDFNADGAIDLSVTGMSFSELIFASSQKGKHSPIGHNSLSDDERLFLKTVGDWLINPDSLERNRYKVVGVSPPSGIWEGFIATSTPSPSLISLAFSTFCSPSRTCALSNTPPSPCTQVVDQYDANGNYIGTGPVDTCQYLLHVWSYVPGTVTLAQNAAFHQDAVTFVDAFEDIINGSMSSYPQIASTVTQLSSYLGASSPIGSSSEECEDAPVHQQQVVGFAWTIPIAACAVAGALVLAAILTRTHDIVDPANETTMYSDGLATGPMPHGHSREQEALDFNPDPFGDDCDPPPPGRSGKLRENFNVLKDTALWRRTDLNVGSPTWWGHKDRITLVEKKRDELKKRYKDICGGDL